LENVLANYPTVKHVATAAFGGGMKILGKTVRDYRDLAKVEVCADELGKKFQNLTK